MYNFLFLEIQGVFSIIDLTQRNSCSGSARLVCIVRLQSPLRSCHTGIKLSTQIKSISSILAIMSTPIVPALSFRPDQSSLPPPGQLLLITDHLASPADFILHRTLSIHLKELKNERVVLVSLTEGFDHWKAIAAKSNVNLSQHLASKSLVFIDGLLLSAYRIPHSDSESCDSLTCPPLLNSNDQSLRELYDLIAKSLPTYLPNDHESASRRTIIIDDISILELMGAHAVALTRFVRALRALCLANCASLIIRAHASASSEPGISLDSDLLRCLLDSCHVHIEVRPLASGRSGAISGEVAIHKGGLSLDDQIVAMRSSAMQYRLTDSGAVFFQKGMDASVL